MKISAKFALVFLLCISLASCTRSLTHKAKSEKVLNTASNELLKTDEINKVQSKLQTHKTEVSENKANEASTALKGAKAKSLISQKTQNTIKTPANAFVLVSESTSTIDVNTRAIVVFILATLTVAFCCVALQFILSTAKEARKHLTNVQKRRERRLQQDSLMQQYAAVLGTGTEHKPEQKLEDS